KLRRLALLLLLVAGLVSGSAPDHAAAAPAQIIAIGLRAPAAGAQASDDPLTQLTRAPWTWETVTGTNAIAFSKDGTCAHTRGNGAFQLEGNTVTVKLPTRTHVLTFDF